MEENMVEEEYAGFSRSVKTGKCEFCDNSYDPSPILEHMLHVHGLNKDGKKVQTKGSIAGGSVSVRAHSRNRPRK